MPGQSILIKNKRGLEVKVDFEFMAYSDWMTYREEQTRAESSVLKYLIEKYVTSITISGEQVVHTDIDDMIKLHIVNAIVSESGFSNEELMASVLTKYKNHILELPGLYDYFLWQNLDMGTYMMLHESDMNTRAKVIAYIETAKDIDIKKRFEFCAKSGESLDLNIPDSKYYKAISKGRKPQPVAADGNNNTNSLIEAARKALEDETRNYQNNQANKKRFFDWKEDARAFGDFDSDTGES